MPHSVSEVDAQVHDPGTTNDSYSSNYLLTGLLLSNVPRGGQGKPRFPKDWMNRRLNHSLAVVTPITSQGKIVWMERNSPAEMILWTGRVAIRSIKGENGKTDRDTRYAAIGNTLASSNPYSPK